MNYQYNTVYDFIAVDLNSFIQFFAKPFLSSKTVHMRTNSFTLLKYLEPEKILRDTYQDMAL